MGLRAGFPTSLSRRAQWSGSHRSRVYSDSSPKWRWPPSLRHGSHAHDAPPDARAEPGARAAGAARRSRHATCWIASTVNPTSPNPRRPAAPPGATIPHEPHFIVGENVKLTTRDVNLALASQVAGFPLASSSGGFTFSVNERVRGHADQHELRPARSRSAGSRSAASRSTSGLRSKSTSFSSFEGVDLDSERAQLHSGAQRLLPGRGGQLPPWRSSDPSAVTPFAPTFERDLLAEQAAGFHRHEDDRLLRELRTVSNRFDVGLAVPIVHVEIDASVDSEILRMADQSVNNPLIHSFHGSGDATETLPARGSASGLGDVLLRAKYNFARTPTTAFAAALDLRLPTGDKDNLLGSGATQTKLFFVGSG